METFLSIAIGIGLSAACGFRIFMPMLVISVASMTGHLTLSEGFEWIGQPYACAAFGIAAVCEILAYYVPWFDNLMDTIATPAAIIAGTVATASVVGDMSPWLSWSLAAVAGGGVAGTIQAGTVLLRGASTATSGGLANPIVSTGELAASIATSIIAIIAPFVALALISIIAVFLIRKLTMRDSPA